METPAGLVTAYVKINKGQIESVWFHNVPSFVVVLDETMDVPGLGSIQYDLAFGGAFYAFVQANQVGLRCTCDESFDLIRKGLAI